MQALDLETRAAVYYLTNRAWHRIEPTIAGDTQCRFMLRFLVDCIRENDAGGDQPHSVMTQFEAATELTSCLKHWLGRANPQIFREAAVQLERLFKASDADTRNRIETFTLEHILEAPALRPYFEYWERDPELATAFAAALAWGRAHEQRLVREPSSVLSAD
jgi:hypothetical protein